MLARGLVAALAALAVAACALAQTPGPPPPAPPIPAPPASGNPANLPPPPPGQRDIWLQPGVESPPPGLAEPNKTEAAKPPPHISIKPRFQNGLLVDYKPVEDGRTAIIVDGGVAIIISTVTGEGKQAKTQYVDIDADRLVIWTKANGPQLFSNMKSEQGSDNGAHELYMSGHVEMRSRGEKDIKTIRAKEIYYDVRRNVAVARDVDMEMIVPKALFPLHIKTPELQQLGPKLFSMKQSEVFSSLLPSDPGMVFDISNMTIEERQYEKSYLYGLWPAYDKDGKRIVTTDHVFTGTNYLAFLEGVPLFYFPYFTGRVEDPLGPLDQVNAGYDTIFGFQIRTTWDLYDIFDLPHFEGTKWQLYLDYLTDRGPGFGTYYQFAGEKPFDLASGKYMGEFKAYGIYDTGLDDLGGNRGLEQFWPNAQTATPITHPDFRGMTYGKVNVQDLPDGFSVLSQFAFLSDRNFQEVYFMDSFLNGPDMDTYVHLKQQQGIWAWTLDASTETEDWFTHTNWLPKLDGYLLGQTFTLPGLMDDLFVFNTRNTAGYAELRPTIQVPYAYLPTDVRTNTARLDSMSDLSMPLDAGPFKIVPYLMGDMAYYSNNVNGDSQGRLYGGAGVRWSLPFSKLYPDITSDIFNLNQIYHKIIFYGNYYAAQSSVGINNIPQLDQLWDNETDQTMRDIRPQQSALNPTYANFLNNSNLVNPQNYALRRLLLTDPDNLDTINALQLGIDQRWQTRRGGPGDDHIVDWMTLNVQTTIFPHSERDDDGHVFGFIDYNWVWNIGDSTALTSDGFWEPFQGGPRAFNLGLFLGRPDSTNVTLAYQQIDPLYSKAIIASIVYPLSNKYAITASTVWDFGDNVTNYGLMFSRMGTDTLVNIGLSYNSTMNVVSFTFEILPNVARNASRAAGLFPNYQPFNVNPILNQR